MALMAIKIHVLPSPSSGNKCLYVPIPEKTILDFNCRQRTCLFQGDEGKQQAGLNFHAQSVTPTSTR